MSRETQFHEKTIHGPTIRHHTRLCNAATTQACSHAYVCSLVYRLEATNEKTQPIAPAILRVPF